MHTSGALKNNDLNVLKKDDRNTPIKNIGAWRSLAAHLLWEQGVGGSNPLAPTNFQ